MMVLLIVSLKRIQKYYDGIIKNTKILKNLAGSGHTHHVHVTQCDPHTYIPLAMPLLVWPFKLSIYNWSVLYRLLLYGPDR